MKRFCKISNMLWLKNTAYYQVIVIRKRGERERERERNMCSLSLCSRTNKFPSETTFSGTDLLLSAVKTFYTETSKTVRKKLLASFPKSYMEWP